MQEDIFDVVDENDQVIGRATRSEAHAQNLRHRAIHVLVFNPEGELFLQKRSKTKDSWPGAWDSSCSGHLDAGETYRAAALRELQEELGWQPEGELEFLFKLLPSEETGHEFIEVYRAKGRGPFRLNTEEIENGEWVSVPNLYQRASFMPKRFTGALRLVLDRLRSLELVDASGRPSIG